MHQAFLTERETMHSFVATHQMSLTGQRGKFQEHKCHSDIFFRLLWVFYDFAFLANSMHQALLTERETMHSFVATHQVFLTGQRGKFQEHDCYSDVFFKHSVQYLSGPLNSCPVRDIWWVAKKIWWSQRSARNAWCLPGKKRRSLVSPSNRIASCF